MNKMETLGEVSERMSEVGARCLRQEKLSNGGMLEIWQVGAETVAVVYYKEGGCSHYAQGHGTGWDAMSTQLHQIAAKSV